MDKKQYVFALCTAFMLTHACDASFAVNPASTQYVDQKILEIKTLLQSQIAAIPPKSPSSFISYYSSQSQNINADQVAYLAFTTPKTTNNTISPSASGSAPINTVDTFTATISGIYMITWNVAITTGNNVNATLDLLIDGTSINTPFAAQGYGGGGGGNITTTVSGGFLTNIDAGQTIQLQASAFVGTVTANYPSISIFRVADLS